MSHFTRVKTQVRDRDLLCESLRRLHHRFQEGERIPIRGYMGNTEYGQVVVDTGSAYDIGYQLQPDQTWSCCADWWGVHKDTALREQSFLREVSRTYAHLSVLHQIQEQGLILEEERVLPSGEIELVVCESF